MEDYRKIHKPKVTSTKNNSIWAISPTPQYLWAVFGTSSAPEHFQKRMTNVLSGINGVLCLMDDVLVFGKDKIEHDERPTNVLKRIAAAGATLNPQKYEFGKHQLKFLGHLIDRDGIRADPDKTTAIT